MSDDQREERCAGCQKMIQPGEPRIHTGLDDALASLGSDLPGVGLDDILRFAWCADCTQTGGPFHVEHEAEQR